jgi:hypothetical protein
MRFSVAIGGLMERSFIFATCRITTRRLTSATVQPLLSYGLDGETMTLNKAKAKVSTEICLRTKVVGYELLEKLLSQRLEEMLVSLKRNDLIGRLTVKVVLNPIPWQSSGSAKCSCGRPSMIIAGKGPFCRDCDDDISHCICPKVSTESSEPKK